MEQDITPALLESIRADFLRILGDTAPTAVTYPAALDYADRVGDALTQAFRLHLSADTLPDGRMYWNIADRVIRPLLEEDHALVADAAAAIQQQLNQAAGLGLLAQRAELDSDRIEGILNKVSASENYEEVSWVLDEPVRTFSRMTVDDTLRANVQFQGRTGLRPRVIRRATGSCCEWCSKLAGAYDYPDVPADVYRRHERCRCKVEYDPGDGRRQNVWNKRWDDNSGRQERIQKIQNLSTNDEDTAKIKEIKGALTTQVLALPESSKEILQAYTGFTATRVNNAIRNGNITPRIQKSIDALDSALASGTMPQSVTLYRNTALSFLDFGLSSKPTEQELESLIGFTHKFPIFTSTSFQDLHLLGRDTVIKMHIPQGYAGCQYLQPVALPKFKHQDEVLFGRGMQYQILNVHIENGRYFLEVEVLSNV